MFEILDSFHHFSNLSINFFFLENLSRGFSFSFIILDSLRSLWFFPATAHTLKYERSEELGKNLALGGIYMLPKFLKISKQNKFPQKKLQI